MKTELKTKVVAALRSGEYVQDTELGKLRVKKGGVDCYCVMGVVADVLDPGGWSPQTNNEDVYQFHGWSGSLSGQDCEALGITAEEQWNRFIDPNDNEKVTFEQFADRLEATAT